MSYIKLLRKERLLKQDDIAELLNITPACYSKKENGRLRFSLVEAKKMSEYFGKSIEEIFFAD